MKIRKRCMLDMMFSDRKTQINEDSPELQFMMAVCAGDVDRAVSFFEDRKQFRKDLSAVDAPYGRFEGLDGIREFASSWLERFNASGAGVRPMFQTTANGRSVTEAVINFYVDGEIDQVPMFIVSDLRAGGMLNEVRLYCHYTFVPGLQAYRAPIFKTAHLEMGDPGLLTGAVREYYEALHHMPAADADHLYEIAHPDCRIGGYERWEDCKAIPPTGAERLRKQFSMFNSYIPRCVGMRYETITDDGVTCVLEWVHVISRAGQEERGRLAMSGIAAYERGEDGRLCSIRICDYANCESTIDWDKLDITLEDAKKVNFVEEFPYGVGAKEQY